MSSESAKVVFAVNYKVMSTSVLSIVHALDHDGEILFEPDVPKAYGNPFNELSRSEQEARLADYTRVLIVRNPFARLYSAWSNKFPEKAANFCEHRLRASGEEYYYCDTSAVRWARIGQRFFKHAGVPVPETSREQLLGVTWRMFLNGVLDEAVFDMHWEPQVCDQLQVDEVSEVLRLQNSYCSDSIHQLHYHT